MKIIQTLINRQLTVQQIGERLPHIPQATLYRHLKLLSDSGLLVIVEEHPVRGTVERVFALAEQGADLTEEDLHNVSRDEHMQYFMHFMASILADFGKYMQRENIELKRDMVGYRQASFYASDDELQELIGTVREAVRQAMEREPAEDRTKRTLTTILLPDDSAR
jgi:DNA-binding PadR family transcriptional regulator